MIKLTRDEIIKSRERRAEKIQNIVKEYDKTVVCMTLNVPGKIRVFELLEYAFNDGCKRFENAFGNSKIIVYQQYSPHATGYEAYYVLDKNAEEVKSIAVRLEDSDDLGGVFNYDVFNSQGIEIKRTDINIPLRKCLLCDQPAVECMKLSTHTPEEVVVKVQQIIEKYYD